MKKKAIFITLEGLEGCGKSTVGKFLVDYLKSKGLKVIFFREPGSTRVGEKIREILLDKRNKDISPYTELLLYLSARTQLIEEKLKNALSKYDVVICDRFYDSTLAYQGYAMGLGDIVDKAVKIFSLGINPDITFILDVSPNKSLKRIKVYDRIESRSLHFHNRVRLGYKMLAKRYPKRIKLIKADNGLDSIFLQVKSIIDRYFDAK